MKFHFEPDLDYQHTAIEAVADLFRGQETCRTEFTVVRQRTATPQTALGFTDNSLGYGNRLQLLPEDLLNNLRAVQLRNGLRPADELISTDFTVEMETGTGKTYVYLRTIFELNKRFGFSKFVIVVPSVAIKEGVYSSLGNMEDHFRGLYANTSFDYFLYDSAKLGQVRNFATNAHIQIMVITVGAINKQGINVIYEDQEDTGGEKPIDLIKSTRPIVIVDEPQKVDGGLKGQGKRALDEMDALCTLRYSATHFQEFHMVYRLDAVDAYEKKLVKQIEVASLVVEDANNTAYVKLLKVNKSKGGTYTAKVEVDVQNLIDVSREPKTIGRDTDFEQLTGRAVYANMRVQEIIVPDESKPNDNAELWLSGQEKPLRVNETIGDVDQDGLRRVMISRTIKEHLDKEQRLTSRGIKVLSLFFIDAVEHYRSYDEQGNAIKGKYAKMFEEEYRKLAALPRYRTLFQEVDLNTACTEVHDGYFAIDKKKFGEKTVEVFTETRGNSAADEGVYNLIMRNKARLLSFDTKLKFIFSHSALSEGWDNPNVFQICALRDVGSVVQRRQTIGRGLRLCVNQSLERIRGFDVNTLTVIANERYQDFADNLQKEIEKDTGIHFGLVEPHQFANIAVSNEDGTSEALGVPASETIWKHLKAQGYIDAKGKVQDTLRTALKHDTLVLPEAFEAQRAQVKETLRKLAGRLDIKNADDGQPVKVRRAVLDSEEFKALWDRIKHKTTYRVEFDNAKLIEECTRVVGELAPITGTRFSFQKAQLTSERSGIDTKLSSVSAPEEMLGLKYDVPDLLTDLQDKTQLTRRSLVRILIDSGRLPDFNRNPQQFIARSAEAINRAKRLALVDGIRYQRLGDQEYYAQELFESEELRGYLHNMVACERSVYEHVVYDSAGVERSFAEDLDRNEAVKVFAKLPIWFKVPTPLGTYNPDWAVLVEKDGTERVYFVVETKGDLFDLREKERGKIECGQAHFAALEVGENPARFKEATNVDDLMKHL
jgi:type III restriction enzyme